MLHRLLSSLSLFCLFSVSAVAADAIPAIPRVLPPEGLEIPAEIQSRLQTRLIVVNSKLDGIKVERVLIPDTDKLAQAQKQRDNKADAEIFAKAVELALAHREFYTARDFEKADWAIEEAYKRIEALKAGGELPWEKSTGVLVRGYVSTIDNSVQPYGLVIPKDHDFSKPCPLYVWLHGRGDKNTDLHFLSERSTRPGQITPPNAIVVHPFGRHCVGWKHAGEIDVLEVVESVKLRYKIDPDRVVLIGFSMGGAGAWHIGAHYTDQWIAVAPGAGFVDTARYQKITPDRYPEWYVQKLWGLYDVSDYVRNLFNTKTIAYSGELDPQRQAAVLMEEAFQGEGRTLAHLIGPGVEHKYEPKALAELLRRLDEVVAAKSPTIPQKVHFQTRTLRYSSLDWVEVLGLEKHWEDARVDAEIRGPKELHVTTKNVSMLALSPQDMLKGKVAIDDQVVSIDHHIADPKKIYALPNGTMHAAPGSLAERAPRIRLYKDGTAWRYDPTYPAKRSPVPRVKFPRLQGPIDDAFISTFTVVTPTGKSKNPEFQKWCDAELEHFRTRWKALMRGKLPELTDVAFEDFVERTHTDSYFNVILWGDPDSNSAIRRILSDLPLGFKDGTWTFGGNQYDGNRFFPTMIYPRRRAAGYWNYIVLNSGLTFREGHDRTNSQQNPKLPDWAIIDLTQPPDAFSPGRIHDADFFDEQWQLTRQPKAL